MIKLLEWDTKFFGYKIGEVLGQPDLDEARREGYALLYVRSKEPLPINSYVDHKIQFKKNVSQRTYNSEISSVLHQELSHELLELAYLSGSHSRFKLDKNFKNNEFQKLYREWLSKSLSGEIANEVLVFKNEGFVTVKIKGDEAHIGLIAVAEKSQGKGIGRLLLEAAEFFAFEKGAKTMHVPTQADNTNARLFYNKYGFEVEFDELTYQVWI